MSREEMWIQILGLPEQKSTKRERAIGLLAEKLGADAPAIAMRLSGAADGRLRDSITVFEHLQGISWEVTSSGYARVLNRSADPEVQNVWEPATWSGNPAAALLLATFKVLDVQDRSDASEPARAGS